MIFTEIKELLDKGFTPEQIMELNKQQETPAVVTEPETTQPEPATPATPAAPAAPAAPAGVTSDQFNALQNSINELTKTIQANAIVNSTTTGQSVEKDMDILANILNPSIKK